MFKCPGKMKIIALILAFATGPTNAQDADQPAVFGKKDWVEETPAALSIYVDTGGRVKLYAEKIAEVSHKEIRILGTCMSSCTMFLGMKNVCVADNATIGFHGPSSEKHWDDPVYMRELAFEISALYPAELKSRFEDDWSRSQTLTWFTGAQVRAMAPGLTQCSADQDVEDAAYPAYIYPK